MMNSWLSTQMYSLMASKASAVVLLNIHQLIQYYQPGTVSLHAVAALRLIEAMNACMKGCLCWSICSLWKLLVLPNCIHAAFLYYLLQLSELQLHSQQIRPPLALLLLL
jgi:hypothetical protein